MVRRNKTKTVNLFITILIALCNMGCYQQTEPETYLIPQGFTGRATVIFNQQNGTPIKYENGRRIYEIPANGICLTQFKPTYGITNRQYYYVDSIGGIKPLPIYRDEHKSDGTTMPIVKDKNEVGIFGDGTTGQYDVEDKAPFQFFFVSTFNGLDTLETNDAFNKRINKLIGIAQ